ncbi:transposase-like zinc-binding domain-containing protein [Pseudoclavibacter soli]|uniref:transposase-like zinc-binding domain-containing protein n=1 Tax=Pseudoclavibacter soli TaxID=452623 RepID=UPI003CCC06FC
MICSTKLVKNGRTTAGTQRWRCPTCGASSSRRRADVSRRALLDRFLAWILGKHSEAYRQAKERARKHKAAPLPVSIWERGGSLVGLTGFEPATP